MPRSTLLFIAAGLVWAQADPSAFEAASLKQVPDNEVAPLSVSPRRSGARFSWSTDLSSMMRYAYRLPRERIAGIEYPRAFFTVTASLDPAATEDQARQMMKALLIDRFKIASHYETKELQGYALVVAKNGPKLQSASSSGEPPAMPEYRKTAPPAVFEGRDLHRGVGSRRVGSHGPRRDHVPTRRRTLGRHRRTDGGSNRIDRQILLRIPVRVDLTPG